MLKKEGEEGNKRWSTFWRLKDVKASRVCPVHHYFVLSTLII